MKKRYFQICHCCDQEAFEYKREPVIGQILKATDIIHSDNPNKFDLLTCQFCKENIDPKFDMIISRQPWKNYELIVEDTAEGQEAYYQLALSEEWSNVLEEILFQLNQREYPPFKFSLKKI
jgi:hypothetical protein